MNKISLKKKQLRKYWLRGLGNRTNGFEMTTNSNNYNEIDDAL